MALRLGSHWDTVLVTGESGAGKEELARCLHQNSLGRNAPFIAVNAALLPESLIEAELFGYERGAFTGAQKAHRGKFEQAHGGTLFLDEIGDMPAALQARLLRVLQDRSITRLGGEDVIKLNVRVILATHKRLNDEVRAGRFREDLYCVRFVHYTCPPPQSQDRNALQNKRNAYRPGRCASQPVFWRIERSIHAIQDAIAPYSRFVRAETQNLHESQTGLVGLQHNLGKIKSQVEMLVEKNPE